MSRHSFRNPFRHLPGILSLTAVLATTAAAHAVSFDFAGKNYDVEYITGSTATSKAMLEVDFGPQHYLFGYQWDGTPKTGFDMLSDIANAGSLDILAPIDPTYGAFVETIDYAGYVYPDSYPTSWWNYFTSADGVTWDSSFIGVSSRDLTDGSWDAWAHQTVGFPNDVTPPAAAVPEPASLALIGVSAVALLRRRK